MRTIIALFLLALCISVSPAQTVDTRRTITVTGSSSMTLTPDIIPVHISIREYYEEEFQAGKFPVDYKTLVSLDNIERDVLGKLRALNIPDSAVKVAQVGTTWRPYWEDPTHRNTRPVMLRKEIIVTLNNLGVVDKLLRSLNLKGVEYVNLGEMRNSREQEHRKQVKIAALKAAREKAQYLAESMGVRLGQILTIREVNEQLNPWLPRTAMMSNTAMDGAASADVEPMDLTLRYEMEAVFEIQ